MENFALAIGLFLFLLVSIFRREWALYLIVLLLPSFQIRFAVGLVPMTFLEGMILILAGVEAIFLLREKKLGSSLRKLLLRTKLKNFVILIFLLSGLTAVLVSPSPIKAAGIYKAFFLEAIIFYYLALLLINTETKVRGLLRAVGVLVIYLSMFGIYQFITLQGLYYTWWAPEIASRRIASVLVYPNALGLLLAPLLGLLLFLPKSRTNWIALLSGLPALYLSFSRGAWLALLVTVPLTGLVTPYRRKLLASAVIGLLLILSVPYSRGKILELASFADPSQTSRFILWGAAVDMIKHSPINGVGLVGFHEAYKNYPLGPDGVVHNYPHNIILNFWTEIGLPGLIAFVGLVIYFYKKVWYLLKTPRRQIALAALAAMTVLILHGLVDAPYFKNDLALIFWLIFALPDLRLQE